jgi:hypothetical protein
MILEPLTAQIQSHKAVIRRVREWRGLADGGWSGLGRKKLLSGHLTFMAFDFKRATGAKARLLGPKSPYCFGDLLILA